MSPGRPPDAHSLRVADRGGAPPGRRKLTGSHQGPRAAVALPLHTSAPWMENGACTPRWRDTHSRFQGLMTQDHIEMQHVGCLKVCQVKSKKIEAFALCNMSDFPC